MSNNNVNDEKIKEIRKACNGVVKHLLGALHPDRNGGKESSFDSLMENYNKILDSYVVDTELKEILKKNGALSCGENFGSVVRLVKNKEQARDLANLVNPIFRQESDYLNFVGLWGINDLNINSQNFTQLSFDNELNEIINESVKEFTENGKNPMNTGCYNCINMARFFANRVNLNQYAIDQDHAKKYVNLWLELAKKMFIASKEELSNTGLRTQEEISAQLTKNKKINDLTKKYKVDASFIFSLYPNEYEMIKNFIASKLDNSADAWIDQIDVRMQTYIYNWRTLDFWLEEEKEYEKSETGKFRNKFNKNLERRIENECKNKKVDFINYNEFMILYKEELDKAIISLVPGDQKRIREKGALAVNKLRSVLKKVFIANREQYGSIMGLVNQEFRIDYLLNFELRDIFSRTVMMERFVKFYECNEKINALKTKYVNQLNQYTNEEFDRIFAYEKNMINTASMQYNIYNAELFILQMECRAKLNSKETFDANNDGCQTAAAAALLIQNFPDRNVKSVDSFFDNYGITIDKFSHCFSYEIKQLNSLVQAGNFYYFYVWVNHIKTKLESRDTKPFEPICNSETEKILDNKVKQKVSGLISSFGFGNVPNDKLARFVLNYKNCYEYKQAAYALKNGYLSLSDIWIENLKNGITKEAFCDFSKKELISGVRPRLSGIFSISKYPIVYKKFGNNYDKINRIFENEIKEINRSAEDGLDEEVDYWFNVIEARLAYDIDLDKPYGPGCEYAREMANLIQTFEVLSGERMSFDNFKDLLQKWALDLGIYDLVIYFEQGVYDNISDVLESFDNYLLTSVVNKRKEKKKEMQTMISKVYNMFRVSNRQKSSVECLKSSTQIMEFVELIKKELNIDISDPSTGYNPGVENFETLDRIFKSKELANLQKFVDSRVTENVNMVDKFLEENRSYSDILGTEVTSNYWGMMDASPKDFLIYMANLGLPENVMNFNINWIKLYIEEKQKDKINKFEESNPVLKNDTKNYQANKVDDEQLNVVNTQKTVINNSDRTRNMSKKKIESKDIDIEPELKPENNVNNEQNSAKEPQNSFSKPQNEKENKYVKQNDHVLKYNNGINSEQKKNTNKNQPNVEKNVAKSENTETKKDKEEKNEYVEHGQQKDSHVLKHDNGINSEQKKNTNKNQLNVEENMAKPENTKTKKIKSHSSKPENKNKKDEKDNKEGKNEYVEYGQQKDSDVLKHNNGINSEQNKNTNKNQLNVEENMAKPENKNKKDDKDKEEKNEYVEYGQQKDSHVLKHDNGINSKQNKNTNKNQLNVGENMAKSKNSSEEPQDIFSKSQAYIQKNTEEKERTVTYKFKIMESEKHDTAEDTTNRLQDSNYNNESDKDKDENELDYESSTEDSSSHYGDDEVEKVLKTKEKNIAVTYKELKITQPDTFEKIENLADSILDTNTKGSLDSVKLDSIREKLDENEELRPFVVFDAISKLESCAKSIDEVTNNNEIIGSNGSSNVIPGLKNLVEIFIEDTTTKNEIVSEINRLKPGNFVIIVHFIRNIVFRGVFKSIEATRNDLHTSKVLNAGIFNKIKIFKKRKTVEVDCGTKKLNKISKTNDREQGI